MFAQPKDEAHEKEFILDLSKFTAKLLNKPEQYISVVYNHAATMSFHGTFDPAFLLHITSLGNINPEANEKYSKALFEYFQEKLNVPGNRGYMYAPLLYFITVAKYMPRSCSTFYDPGRAYLGHEGTTFATIFGKE
ncbi:hypothetical protein FRC11_011286 [Ceratobasidium sp. 423]|nr:hypothetical protein FRC11_011286 [Ceratobasidium sp. 423]